MNHFKLGQRGEEIAKHELRSAGYAVAKANGQGEGDLLVSKGQRRWRLEVKMSRRGLDGRWRFLLRKKDQWGTTDHRHADYVLLICYQRRRPAVLFLIPSRALPSQRSLSIPSNPATYAGRYAKYRIEGRLKL